MKGTEKNRVIVSLTKEYVYSKTMLEPGNYLYDAIDKANQDFAEEFKAEDFEFSAKVTSPVYYFMTEKQEKFLNSDKKVAVKKIAEYFFKQEMRNEYGIDELDPHFTPRYYTFEEGKEPVLQEAHKKNIDKLVKRAENRVKEILE